MSVLRVNERLITRPSTAYDTLLDNLAFVIYPAPGIMFDLARNRNIDQNKSNPSFGYANDGTPGVKCPAGAELWSPGITTELKMYDSGVGVGGAFSFWLWIYFKTVNTGNTNFCGIIDMANYVSESNNQGWQFTKAPASFGSDGSPRMQFNCFNNDGSSSYSIVDSSINLSAGAIHQYVMNIQFDPSNNGGIRRLYRDNAIRSNPPGHGYKTPTSKGINVAAFEGSGSPANDFLILGFGIWTRTITDAEIAALWNYPELLLAPTASTANSVQRLFRPAAAGATVKGRRTFGDLGTRVGSRQGR